MMSWRVQDAAVNGDQVEAHALPRVRADPVGRRKPGKTCIVCLFTHAASPINPRLLAASDIFNLLIYINICRLARMLRSARDVGPREVLPDGMSSPVNNQGSSSHAKEPHDLRREEEAAQSHGDLLAC